jgi:hypothetical protein
MLFITIDATLGQTAMSGLLTNILGFSLFGLAARFGQLGIEKRPLMSSCVHTQLIFFP